MTIFNSYEWSSYKRKFKPKHLSWISMFLFDMSPYLVSDSRDEYLYSADKYKYWYTTSYRMFRDKARHPKYKYNKSNVLLKILAALTKY